MWRAVWHDRAVWHEPEQFSLELNHISLPCLYSLFVRVVYAGAIYRTEVYTKVYAGAIYTLTKCPRVGQALLQQLVRTYSRADGTTKGRKHNRNKSKSWKIGEIKDKEVNMAAGDSDDALVCCVENTVEDRIMNSGASFHATYCKEELERFKLRSGKVRLADNKTLDIAGIGDVVLKTSFGTSWTLKDVRIRTSMLASKGNVPDVRKVDIYFCNPSGLGKQKNLSFIMLVKIRKLQSRSCGRYNTNFQFGVAERLSRTIRAESTGIRVEAPNMLWADSVSTAYLIYRIPYVPIGLHIPDEEWQGKDTSLTHLKVFGCDSFVKVKDVCGEAMKCTFIGSGSDEVRYNFWDTKSHQSPGGSSDTSEGSENSGSFKDSGRSDEEYSEDGASSKEGGSETP
ncbi:hypothetical protein Tco_0635469 [Tanacetum coccineum]